MFSGCRQERNDRRGKMKLTEQNIDETIVKTDNKIQQIDAQLTTTNKENKDITTNLNAKRHKLIVLKGNLQSIKSHLERFEQNQAVLDDMKEL